MVTGIGSNGQMLGPGERRAIDKKQKPINQITSFIAKKVKNGVKAIPQYLQGDSINMPAADPDDYNEDEAWNDVKKAKQQVDDNGGGTFKFSFNANGQKIEQQPESFQFFNEPKQE